ncbi:MAG: hypothetical protein ACK4JC_08850 [Silanimonas lenta]
MLVSILVGLVFAGFFLANQKQTPEVGVATNSSNRISFATPATLEATSGGSITAPEAVPRPTDIAINDYLCSACGGVDRQTNPFTAESVQEAQWMYRKGFPTLSQRTWVDGATIDEVERRALKEGDNPVWVLELIRKRCSQEGVPMRICLDELSRARRLLQTQKLEYASYVISESCFRLAVDRSRFESNPTEARHLLSEAVREITLAGLRGDGKARFELIRIAGNAPPWFSDRDFAHAIASAMSTHEVISRARQLRGLPPMAPEYRPSISAEATARQITQLPGP